MWLRWSRRDHFFRHWSWRFRENIHAASWSIFRSRASPVSREGSSAGIVRSVASPVGVGLSLSVDSEGHWVGWGSALSEGCVGEVSSTGVEAHSFVWETSWRKKRRIGVVVGLKRFRKGRKVVLFTKDITGNSFIAV